MEIEPMNGNDQIIRLLEEIQHTVKEQAQRSAFRWKIVVGVAIASFIIAAPAIFSYIYLQLVRMF
jgi:hypothetical protein